MKEKINNFLAIQCYQTLKLFICHIYVLILILMYYISCLSVGYESLVKAQIKHMYVYTCVSIYGRQYQALMPSLR